jgi:hypothetical protein
LRKRVVVDPSAEQLKGLLKLCRSSDFAHAEEVVPLLEDVGRAKAKGVRITMFEMPLRSRSKDPDLRRTYRRRAAHLTEMERSGTLCTPSPSGRILPPTLAADIRALSAALDDADDQPVAIWSIRMPDRVCFGIFVLANDARIAGCDKSVEEEVLRGGTK